MEWVLIAEIVLKFIEQCQENRDREEIEAGLVNPGILERVMLHRALLQHLRKEEKLKGRKLRKAARGYLDEGMDQLRSMTPGAIHVFVGQAYAA